MASYALHMVSQSWANFAIEKKSTAKSAKNAKFKEQIQNVPKALADDDGMVGAKRAWDGLESVLKIQNLTRDPERAQGVKRR